MKIGGSGLAVSEITRLLDEWAGGNPQALHRLAPLVYDELHRLAAHHFRRERASHTWQTTALVHETFLRLAGQRRVTWRGRAHFYAVASGMMRRILVDHARGRARVKRGGGARPLALEKVGDPGAERAAELVALDDALADLGRVAPRQARVVELRIFGGLSDLEIAAAEGVSPRTVSRRWHQARAWLRHQLTDTPSHEP